MTGSQVGNAWAARDPQSEIGHPLPNRFLVGRMNIGGMADIDRDRHLHMGIGVCNFQLQFTEQRPVAVQPRQLCEDDGNSGAFHASRQLRISVVNR